MIPIQVPIKSYTGEGFKGERTLQIIAVVGGIVLLGVSLYSLNLQIRHTRLQLMDFERKENDRISNMKK